MSIKRISTIAVMFILFFTTAGLAADANKENKNIETVETKIDLDQIVLEDKAGPAVQSNKVEERKSSVSKDKKAVKVNVSSQTQDMTLDEQKLLQLSQSLKNAIDENKELKKDRERILEEVKKMRGEREVDTNRSNALFQEGQELKKRLEELQKTHEEEMQKSQESQNKLQAELEAASDEKIKALETKLKKIEEELSLEKKLNEAIESLKPAAEEGDEPSKSGAPGRKEENPQRMLSRMHRLTTENEKLKNESAKVHYNLGNMFFKQGEYERAAKEYERAVKLMPYDAANHYNLAFVSGEFLNDHTTALKHYQQYLFLNPNAKDALFVKEKILKSRMEIKAAIDSPIEERNQINDNF